MRKHETNPQQKRQAEVTSHFHQLQAIYQYLQVNIATASIVADATGIYQKNICRYKWDLETTAKLWEIEKTISKITGFKAWYLTTDKAKAFNCLPQLNLF